jgi:DNA polymerase-3 subunit alpha
VVRARTTGPFKDLFDFCERIDVRVLNRATIERLIKAGAFDRFAAHRAQLMHLLPRALQAAAQRQSDRRAGQRSLFAAPDKAASESDKGDVGALAVADFALSAIEPWPEAQKLRYEKEVLDFYVSSHPLAQMERELRRYASHRVVELPGLAPATEVTLGGMLTQLEFRNTKKARNGNSRYMLCRLEDFTGTARCVMWPDDLARQQDEAVADRVCFVRGTVDRSREEVNVVLTRILSPEHARRELARALYLLLRLGQHGNDEVDRIGQVLQKSPGPCPVYLTIKDGADRFAVLRLGRDFAINPATLVQDDLESLLGPGGVRLM